MKGNQIFLCLFTGYGLQVTVYFYHMSDKVLYLLTCIVATLLVAAIFAAGYFAGGLGWWWAGLGVIIVYFITGKLIGGHH